MIDQLGTASNTGKSASLLLTPPSMPRCCLPSSPPCTELKKGATGSLSPLSSPGGFSVMVEVPIVFPLYVHLILVVFLDEVSSSGLAVVSFTEMVTGARAVTSEFFTSSVGVGLGLGGLVVLLVVVNTVKGVVDLVGGGLVTVCC